MSSLFGEAIKTIGYENGHLVNLLNGCGALLVVVDEHDGSKGIPVLQWMESGERECNTDMEAGRAMTEQDNHITPDQNTPDNNTTEQTTTQLNAPHYITKSPQHNTKNLPLQVLGGGTSEHLEISSHEVVRVKLAPVELPELSEEQLAFAREWVAEMLMSREGVKMVGEYMDRKAEAQQRLWGSSLMEAEERAIDDWWKDEKGEI